MPAKNSLKNYIANGYYHVYNRGVAKNDIFLDENDYKTFIFYLKVYLLSREELKDLNQVDLSRTERKNFNNRIELLAFCLMPNHYHLLIKQKDEYALSDFMKCIMTSYSMYFNKKYERVGTLFQGRYKAVLVQNDEYLVHLTRYIHINPCKGQSLAKLDYDFSSYKDYIGTRNAKWIYKKEILESFKTDLSYENFVKDAIINETELLGNLTLESC